ncbi:uncharacterized protein LOC122529463 isoform X2 [Frieseomelitta varia]|nr:uncharacterized protein LOC122529463 isoform X2 [Frieseomelitta varia]XP_043511560.1 uncharacterized protein LOC122529463 isoform X2 [Frieseomelitta varia]XP_043511561.1 uncharacterized protein LOC122529463 isoform X2 [Frieseomelitta varia]
MTMSVFKIAAILLLTFSSISFARSNVGSWEVCGGRLERALDALHKDSNRRKGLEEEEAGTFYQQKLRSVPLEMSVSRIAVKLPQGARNTGNPWARVEKCIYEPSNNSLQTRVMLNDLSVSGIVSLMPRDHQPPIPAESCTMTLRLRRAGVDFLTSPIARGRGQMRIRTESSFLEPRFASIYAYGCHPTRLDKQIKRQDKWPPFYPPRDEYALLSLALNDDYEAAEPRQLVGVSKEVDVVIPNETRQSRIVSTPIAKLGIWRKNVWLTKSLPREKRALVKSDVVASSSSVRRFPGSFESGQEASSHSIKISAQSAETITPQDFATALISKRSKSNETGNCTEQHQRTKQSGLNNVTKILPKNLEDSELKTNVKRENSYQMTENDAPKETRHLYIDETLDNIFPIDLENDSRNWQSKEHIAREMEDVFLRGASQALTRYIEKQLHPAIKETLMISMGYTISYG